MTNYLQGTAAFSDVIRRVGAHAAACIYIQFTGGDRITTP